MAGIIPSPGAPVGGSYGSITIGRNRYGTYMRNRTKPVNPNSTGQQEARAAFGAAVWAWTFSLTTAERNGWNDWAMSVPWLNKAGETVHLSGQAAYVRYATYLVAWGYDIEFARVAPAYFSIPVLAVTAATLVLDTSDTNRILTITRPLIANPELTEGDDISVLVSRPANVSQNFRPNEFRRLAISAVPDPPTDTTVFTTLAANFPWTLSNDGGQRVWIKVRAIIQGVLTEEKLFGPILTTTQA
jgi:hypothetical protein